MITNTYEPVSDLKKAAHDDIEVGSVVRLRSGGPAMTVTSEIPNPTPHTYVYASWFDGGSLQRGSFDTRALEMAT